MKIYIGFSKPTPGGFVPFAWLIQKVISRPYDHVYIRFPEPMTQEYMIFQASSRIVNLYGLRLFNEVNTVVKEYEIECTDYQYLKLWTFIKHNLGVPYSLMEDLGILLMKIFKLKKQPFSKGMSAEFCSKLGAMVCQILDIEIDEDPDAIDPSRLDFILSYKQLKSVDYPNLTAL